MLTQILVEGNDECHVIPKLCFPHGLAISPGSFKNCQGYSELLQLIPVVLKSSGLTKLGVIIDANSNPLKRWQSVRTAFLREGISLPEDISPDGLIFDEKGVRIGVWLMPNNEMSGTLENIIETLVPKGDKSGGRVNVNIDAIETDALHKYPFQYTMKARIHSWRSCQEEPGTPYVMGIV